MSFKAVPQFTCPQWRSAGWLLLNRKATSRSASGVKGLWGQRRVHWVASVFFAFMAAGVVPTSSNSGSMGLGIAQAQNLGMRVVSGIVVNADSAPLAGATVFLKDLKNKNIRSYTSDAEGKYRFTGVNMAQDHELWAEKDGKKSLVKTVSSWDTRKEFVQELKLK